MRSYGISDNKDLDIAWLKGCAEDTGLEDSQVELVTMASSFHWTDFEVATKEIRRILTPGGWFVALWNQRLIEENPLLIEIEQHLKKLVPNLKRVSSGKSDFCNTLTDRFIKCGRFNDVVYMEGRHIERMTADRYVGIWRSVNDVRVQAGQERFEEFIDFIKARLRNADYIDATYLTRAWAAKRPV
jgi:ubiquinone/menaquinone biosynthesis C-methylase UbiE